MEEDTVTTQLMNYGFTHESIETIIKKFVDEINIKDIDTEIDYEKYFSMLVKRTGKTKKPINKNDNKVC